MSNATVAEYGSWKSPLTASAIAAGTIKLGHVAVDGADVYWSELRPSEDGRMVIVRRTADGDIADVTPAGMNARTRVHEYGGGDFAVSDGVVYFSNFDDQRLYRQVPGKQPRAITPADSGWRYADAVVDERRRAIIAVREDHSRPESEPANTIVAIDIESGKNVILASGNDFYAAPRVDGAGGRLAWITWKHPNMPWDGTELWVAALAADGSAGERRRVAGGASESVLQPMWAPDGSLIFVSDRTGWWNLYRWRDDSIEALTERAGEFAGPLWTFGQATYGFESSDHILCSYTDGGADRLARVALATRELEPIDVPYTSIASVHVAGDRVVVQAGSPTELELLAKLDPASGEVEVLRRTSDMVLEPGYVSQPEAIEFPTEGGLTAHAWFYPPANRDYAGPPATRPPLLVFSHGGPTGASPSTLNLAKQYWTSRGFAVVDVNYGGSTGYGREYRERLRGQWGVVDVDDCVNAARYLVERGDVDRDRLAIRGGSAGGYTTLCALTFRDLFRAGASHFGVSDLEGLAEHTHKFESRYLDALVGPFPAARQLYRDRSPINHADRISCPVIFFQGLDDAVVPPVQSESLAEALRHKGVPVAYLPFEGEQHGFRRAPNIIRALEGELYFYSRIFGFEPADSIAPVAVDNL